MQQAAEIDNPVQIWYFTCTCGEAVDEFKRRYKTNLVYKTNAAEMLKRVNETHNPIVITQNGEAKAVLVDTESYQDMRNSLGILKLLSEGEKDIKNRNVRPQDNVVRSHFKIAFCHFFISTINNDP